MVAERSIHRVGREAYNFSYFIPAMINLTRSDLPGRGHIKIIAMAFFNQGVIFLS